MRSEQPHMFGPELCGEAAGDFVKQFPADCLHKRSVREKTLL
jgi:hypothetical protein